MERIKYLESKLPKTVTNLKGETISVEEKYLDSFNKYAQYMGNGIYSWKGILAKDTAELFLLGVLKAERIVFNEI